MEEKWGDRKRVEEIRILEMEEIRILGDGREMGESGGAVLNGKEMGIGAYRKRDGREMGE